ncbi:hypothetical protein [Catalinimonas alkaloidigena]|nr:hypothetical protein [Catalinimonas alkaloidigena]
MMWLSLAALAQSPQRINYQAVARDASGNVLPNREMNVRITILSGQLQEDISYVEVHEVTTNAFGLFTLQIGNGTPEFGTLGEVAWESGSHHLQVEVDPDGGTNYIAMGVNPLVSVPYALYAQDVANKDDADADPTNELQTLTLRNDTLFLSDGSAVKLADNSATNELLQSARLNGKTLELVDAGGTQTIDLSGLVTGLEDADADPTNELLTGAQLNGTKLELTDNGGKKTVELASLKNDADADPGNELIEEVKLTGTKLQIIDAGGTKTVELASLQDGVNDADADPNNELLTNAVLNGTKLELTDRGGKKTVELASLKDGVNDADADPNNELITDFSMTGTTLTIKDRGGNKSVSLAGLINDADADATNELLTSATLDGMDLKLTDAGGTKTVDLSSLKNDADADATNELLSNAQLSGTELQLTDAGGTKTVDLASLVDDIDADTTNELLTSATLDGMDLKLTDAGGTKTVDLSSLKNDADADATNELILGLGLVGTKLQVVEPDNTQEIDLAPLLADTSWALTGNDVNTGEFIGSKNAADLVFKTDNTERMVLSAAGRLGIGYTSAAMPDSNHVSVGEATGDAHAAVAGYASGKAIGLLGINRGDGAAVLGQGARGVVGQQTRTNAGDAAVFANGELLSSGTQGIVMDHPADPTGQMLRHFALQSNEVLHVYRGRATLDGSGSLTVTLPAYFADINGLTYTYHLTPIGKHVDLYVQTEVSGNTFEIGGGTLADAGTVVSWVIYVDRDDAYLQAYPQQKQAEVSKTAGDAGKYLQPALYGAPASGGIFPQR